MLLLLLGLSNQYLIFKNMNYKNTIYAFLVVIVLIGGVLFLKSRENVQNSDIKISKTVTSGDNIEMKDGKQIINIDVKGGYWPRKTVAKAGVPTVIRFKTNNTFDCSLSVRLPSEGVSKILSQTGSSEIEVGTSTVGQFFGTCGMGMYSFEIDFQD